jgi:hypothetical protein
MHSGRNLRIARAAAMQNFEGATREQRSLDEQMEHSAKPPLTTSVDADALAGTCQMAGIT